MSIIFSRRIEPGKVLAATIVDVILDGQTNEKCVFQFIGMLVILDMAMPFTAALEKHFVVQRTEESEGWILNKC
eukprot:scaffold19_cov114-Cylindrotheca_fusiformis.AAC.16